MKLKVFVLRDSKSETYLPPFYQKSHGEAERTLRTWCENKESMVGKYPEDFDLFFLGEWDDLDGKFETVGSPQHMMKALHVLSKTPKIPEIQAVQ